MDNMGKTIVLTGSTDQNYLMKTRRTLIKDRKTARKIDLEVGDILLYQRLNVAHWRERFLGDHSYHVFLHFSTIWFHIGGMKDGRGYVSLMKEKLRIQPMPFRW